ncbi:Poly(A) polymerase [Blastomyces dermatitidis ATCC 18188]|uniref:Poly(A) polymerase n=1 Tax=Ajellomyces dermatitidis (strain ATCC 18188 / CBS 674.68) TaxID=653446 RepID=F2TDH1_AJEDA|nr:Poly(A) polymerase [Blastomyces dermatitidis ATCC 18188]
MTARLAQAILPCAQPTRRTLLTHSATRHIIGRYNQPSISWTGTKSVGFFQKLRCLTQPLRNPMSFREKSSLSPEERPSKRRRILGAFVKEDTQRAMTKDSTTSSTVPRITLTPIEQTLRLCLLDAVEFIQQRDKEDTQALPTDVEPLVLRFAGGWVRDKLLGVDSHDIDVAINCITGERFGEGLKEYLDTPGNLEKYKAFHSDPSIIDCIKIHKIEKNPEKSKHLETATTKIFGLEVDLVNLRKETYTDDSRNPQIEIGTPEEDALRRDATVNALFYNIHTDMIEDFTGKGLQDLENKIIRTPMAPFQTFKDDPLRVLRLIRFASRLGYSIDSDTEEAMKIEDIKAALKAKITQERIGVEMEKTLRGPDPLTALQRINRLGLYDTIFANHRDNAGVDTSSWERGYNALTLLLSESTGNIDESQKTREYVRDTLIRDENERYFAWFLTALAPWVTIADPVPPKPSKPTVPRATTVARDSLRADNKAASIISAASKNYQTIWDIKSSFLKNEIADTPSETRVKIGLFIRTLSHDWRLCFVLAMLLEVMRGQEADHVFHNYEKLLSYIENTNLLDVCSLRSPINGRDIINALGVKTGPWMSKAVDMVIEWQLRNPDEASKEAAINEVLRRKDELGLNSKTMGK